MTTTEGAEPNGGETAASVTLPVHAKDVASMLVHAKAGNQQGRHTLDLERAQAEDRWRDDGGQG